MPAAGAKIEPAGRGARRPRGWRKTPCDMPPRSPPGCKTNRGGATGIGRDDGVYHAADPEAARSTRPSNFRQARVVDARPAPRSRVVLHVAHVASGDCLRAVGANPTEVFRPEHPQQLTADLARSVR
jgi:hypothetical protein